MSERAARPLPIGAVTRLLGLSADTLRYYEKIGLLPRVGRTASGLRRYAACDLSRLRFIRRAQTMNFTLAEIGALLRFREDPTGARPRVRELTARKFSEVERRLGELEHLRDELRLLLNLCAASRDGCPVIEGIEGGGDRAPRARRGGAGHRHTAHRGSKT